MMNKYVKSTVFCLLLFSFLQGCGSSGDNNLSNQPALPPSNIEEAKSIAKNHASVHSAVDFRVEHVTDSELSHPFFEGYYFLYIWGPMGHTQSSSFAVAPDGSSYLLPNDYNSLAKHADISLTTQEQAESLLNFYLNFHTVWPGTDAVKMINDSSEIPGLESESANLESSLQAIHPLTLTETSTGWAVNFFTWRAVNGVLSEWNSSVSRNGSIESETVTTLDSRIGNYLSIE